MSELISKAQREVLVWKEKVGNEIKGKSFEEKRKIFADAVEDASKILNTQAVKEPDGIYRLKEK